MSETVADGQAAAAPSLIINAQYLRDLSFENPRAPESLLGQNAPPEVAINADVRARQLGEDVFEVVIDLKVEARQGEEVGFLIEVSYGAVATIKNAPQELMAALILIEVPRILFPFARNIVADATRDGGFPPLLINPIDFGEIQRRKAQEGQAVAGNA